MHSTILTFTLQGDTLRDLKRVTSAKNLDKYVQLFSDRGVAVVMDVAGFDLGKVEGTLLRDTDERSLAFIFSTLSKYVRSPIKLAIQMADGVTVEKTYTEKDMVAPIVKPFVFTPGTGVARGAADRARWNDVISGQVTVHDLAEKWGARAPQAAEPAPVVEKEEAVVTEEVPVVTEEAPAPKKGKGKKAQS